MRLSRLAPAAVLAVALAGLAAPAFATAPAQQPAAVAPRPLRRPQRYKPTGRLEVKFKPGVSRTAQSAALSRVTASGLRVRVDRRIAGLNAVLLSVSDARAVLRALRADGTVAYVEPEQRYHASAVDTITPEATEIGSAVTRQATTATLGDGTEIAVIDSQVDATNADLDGTGKVVFAGDFSTDVPDMTGVTDSACDPANCPHGTAVAVAAAGEDGDGNLAGVAPNAVIRSYNVFRRFVYTGGYQDIGASSADIADALGDVATYASTHPALVAVNMSLGGSFDDDLIKDAIAALHTTAPRVTMVVAAGNDGRELADFPAGDPYVLSVGATGQVTGSDCSVTPAPSTPWTVAFFSNRGDVDVVAPGHCVSLWYPPEDEETGMVTGPAVIQKVSGTSFAAPMVAGEVALLASSTNTRQITGDAARAAIIAGANHTGANVNIGEGKADVNAALALTNGSTPYTAMSVDRGGQVPTVVGTRKVEALRFDPTGAPTPVPVLGVTSGFGSYTGVSTTSVGGLSTKRATFNVSSVNRKGLTFNLTADSNTVPMKMLDAADGFEGVPAANNEATSVPLTFGSRTSYVRSANVLTDHELDWAWTFDPHGFNGLADLFVWEPTTSGGKADAAMPPIADEFFGSDDNGAGTDGVVPGQDACSGSPLRACYAGRWLIGWVTALPFDNSSATTSYKLKLTYDGPTATLNTPAVASVNSTSGPFTVSWGGLHAVKWDVWYTTKTKVGSSWVLGSWKAWKTGTPNKSAVFGSGGLPVTVKQGQSYHFMVKAYDSRGNPSLTKTGYTAVPVDDRYPYLSYSAGWGSYVSSGHWFSTVRQIGTAGAKVSLKSESQRFTVVGDRCTACGQIRIYVDGVYKGTVDTHAASTQKRQTLWSSPLFSSIKTHTLTIVVVGTAGRPTFVLDGIGSLR
jgi:membrane-anchored mycosin MYCP